MCMAVLSPTSMPILAQSGNPEFVRRSANFPPSIWRDRFLKHDPIDLKTLEHRRERVKELKEVVKREVFKTIRHDDDPRQLKLIDSVQRLGLSYHFQEELGNVFEQTYHTYEDHVDKATNLSDLSLRFRLLRQHGCHVSSGVFEKFKDKSTGNFNDFLAVDVPGMLALYEASHMSIPGEDLLDEALDFTTTHLEAVARDKERINHSLSTQIRCALKRPIRKSLHRAHARQYISFYAEEASNNKCLLELAELDFSVLQNLHAEELSDISRWWKELELVEKLPYIRDKVVEIFITIVGVYFEPKYRLTRNILMKVILCASAIDDTYDSYGTFAELKLFTEAIQRWDISYKNQLPEYMQVLYGTILETYQDFEELVEAKEYYRIHYAKEALKILTKAYLDEARWLHQKYIPTMEEYLSASLITAGISMFTATAFIGIEDFVGNDVYEWLFSDPQIFRAASSVGRLMNDIRSHKFEQERGHLPSSVECYRKQHMVSEQEAYTELNKIVVNAWKEINQEILTKPKHIPILALNCFDNMARVNELFYRDGDGFTSGGQEISETVTTLFIDENFHNS